MHLTDEQLNEYLDNETVERAVIETHLAACDECAARLSALQTLFAELDALPDVELTRSFNDVSLWEAARFTPHPDLAQQPPAWLTLTATLQAVVAVLALAVASPFLVRLLPALPAVSVADLLLKAETLWLALLDLFASLRIPAVPQPTLPELPNLALTAVLIASSLLWLVGNGLLLKRQT